MPRKKLDRALKELDVYAERRDLPLNFSCFNDDFGMLVSIPGLFEPEIIIKEVKIVESLYPSLIPGILPNLKPILSAEQFSTLETLYSKREPSKISNLEEWETIEQTLSKYCDQILPFLAKSFQLEIPSTSTEKSNMYVDSTKKCTKLRIKTPDDEFIQCAAFAKDLILTGSTSGMIYKVPFERGNGDQDGLREYAISGIEKSEWQIHKWPIQDICYTNMHSLFVSCDSTGGIRAWDSNGFKRLAKYDVRNGPVWQLAVPCSSDQKMFASAHEDGTARLFYYDRSDCLRMFEHKSSVSHVAFHSRLIATSIFSEKAVRIWDIDMGYQIRLIDGMDSAISALVLLDDNHVASVTTLGTLDISEISNSKIVASAPLDFQKNEDPSFLTRLSKKEVAIGGTSGSLFFATFLSNKKLEVVKKLSSENKSKKAVLAVKWDEIDQGFCAVFS